MSKTDEATEAKVAGDFKGELVKHVGEKIAVICARYQYRGRLSVVAADCLVLANATAVEVSGSCAGDRPDSEDAVGGSVIIKHDAVEIAYQPNWVNAPLPGEE